MTARSDAFKLSREESQRARTFLRKTANEMGGIPALADLLAIRPQTLNHAVNPKCGTPSAILVLRVAMLVKVPVEDVLTGKLIAEAAREAMTRAA